MSTIPPFDSYCGKTEKEVYDLLTPYKTEAQVMEDGQIVVKNGRWTCNSKVSWLKKSTEGYLFSHSVDPTSPVPDNDYEIMFIRARHPTGGYHLFFRPDLYEIMCLVSTHVLLDMVTVIYCTTRQSTPCYNAATDTFDCITTLLIQRSRHTMGTNSDVIPVNN